MNIAILGATSHIAKGLIHQYSKQPGHHLFLFSRRPECVQAFVNELDPTWKGRNIIDGYQDFSSYPFDLIINCVGVETRNANQCDFTRYFSVTEQFDNLVIDYLKHKSPKTLYISFSSGAVYGKGFSEPATPSSRACHSVNHLQKDDFYAIVRLNAEAKHRAHDGLRIVDLRVFSYFSRYINTEDGYLVTDIFKSILQQKTLITQDANVTRDYLHMDDLFSFIERISLSPDINEAIDLMSAKPISKTEMIDHFQKKFGLEVINKKSLGDSSATGEKQQYYSTFSRASELGHQPKYTSMETLDSEIEILLQQSPSYRRP